MFLVYEYDIILALEITDNVLTVLSYNILGES